MKKIVFLLLILALTGCQFQNTAINLDVQKDVVEKVVEPVFGAAGDTISHDATSTEAQTFDDPKVWSHTVGNGCTNRLLIVGTASNTRAPSSVTYAGVAMTNIGTDNQGNFYASLWYLVNPPTGANDVSVDYSTVTYGTGVASSYCGVDQNNPLDASDSAVGDTTGPDSISLSSSNTNSLYYDILSLETTWATACTAGAGQTERIDSKGSFSFACASEEENASAGSNAISQDWDGAFSSEFAHVAAVFNPIDKQDGLKAMAGNFALNTSTGNQSIVGVGFQPKAVIFIPAAEITANETITADFIPSFGVASSTTARGAISMASDDNAGTTIEDRRHASTTISVLLAGGTTDYEADLVSLDSNGFTINITNAPTNAAVVGFLAIGGSDLTNVAAKNFTTPTSTGNSAVTGVGFQPDAIILFGIGENTAPNTTQTNSAFAIGFGVSSSQQAALNILGRDAQNLSPSGTSRYQRTDKVYVHLVPVDTVYLEGSLVSMDSDGFTINWTTVAGVNTYVYYLALKGGSYAVGSLTSQTSTGNFSETGLSFTPSAGILSSFLTAASASVQQHMELSLGVMSSTTEMFVLNGMSEDDLGTSDSDTAFSRSKMYRNHDFAGAKEGDASFVSWNSDGFTLNQTDADPSANEIIYLVMGETSEAPPASEEHIGQPVIWFDTSD